MSTPTTSTSTKTPSAPQRMAAVSRRPDGSPQWSCKRKISTQEFECELMSMDPSNPACTPGDHWRVKPQDPEKAKTCPPGDHWVVTQTRPQEVHLEWQPFAPVWQPKKVQRVPHNPRDETMADPPRKRRRVIPAPDSPQDVFK